MTCPYNAFLFLYFGLSSPIISTWPIGVFLNPTLSFPPYRLPVETSHPARAAECNVCTARASYVDEILRVFWGFRAPKKTPCHTFTAGINVRHTLKRFETRENAVAVAVTINSSRIPRVRAHLQKRRWQTDNLGRIKI